MWASWLAKAQMASKHTTNESSWHCTLWQPLPYTRFSLFLPSKHFLKCRLSANLFSHHFLLSSSVQSDFGPWFNCAMKLTSNLWSPCPCALPLLLLPPPPSPSHSSSPSPPPHPPPHPPPAPSPLCSLCTICHCSLLLLWEALSSPSFLYPHPIPWCSLLFSIPPSKATLWPPSFSCPHNHPEVISLSFSSHPTFILWMI